MRRSLHRAAALVIVCVFASLPTLARVHDRLSTHDDVSAFRLSKNLERPHEKISVAVALEATPALRLTRDRSICRDAVNAPAVFVASRAARPIPSRAPPAL